MNLSTSITNGGKGHLLALIAGAIFPLGLAPLTWWPVIPISLALLVLLLEDQSPGQSFKRAWLYGVGFNGVGVSWVYVSIHYFGHTPMWLALIATALFVAFLALLLFALPFWLYSKLKLDRYPLLNFPALWVLIEWSKIWLLSGFPWLWAGYGFIDTPLAGLAPVTGVLGISFVAALTGVGLRRLLQRDNPQRWPALVFPLLLWGVGYGLSLQEWTQPQLNKTLKVALLQGNIEQDQKWDPQYRDAILRTYKDMTEKSWNADLILWPEAAYPVFYHEALPFITNLGVRAREKNVAIVSGVPFWERVNEQSTFYNSIFVIGAGDGLYHKQKLVPFGEYVPLEQFIRGLIPFFNLPMSSFTRGAPDQAPLDAKGLLFSAYICYEIVYPELVRLNAQGRDFLVTISNDAWFGRSWGPLQHFEMARMRALETGKYLLRGTNTGITAVIDHKGRVTGQIPSFQPGILNGVMYGTDGMTPYVRIGYWPVLGLAGLLLVMGMGLALRPQPEVKIRPLYHG